VSGRRQLWGDVGVVWLVFVTCAGWVLAPAVVRHLAGADPFLYQTLPIADAEPAGGAAWRAVLPPAARSGPWAPRQLEILERGRPLERARPRDVREEGGGRYAVSGTGELLFASSTPAPLDLRDYAVRRPRALPAPIVRAAAAVLLLLTATTLWVIVRGLMRARVLGRVAAAVGTAVAAWAVAAAAIEKTTPWVGSDLIGQKLALLAAQADDYDAIFVGSSRIYRQLEPETFDAVFAAAGVPMRSFNLGAPDMRMLEVLFLARRLLDNPPRRLDLVVIDAESDPLFIREENLRSERIVRWHDARNGAAILREVRRTSAAPAEALHRAGRHAPPLALHVTQLGRGHGLLARLTGSNAFEFPLDQRGFFAGDEEMVISPSPAQRAELELFSRRLHDDLDRWHRDIARLAQSPRSGALTDPFEIELFAELERLAERAGVRAVFLIDARPEETPNLVWAAENGVVSTLLRFDDPRRYPQLYDPALRFDRHHVSKAGARIYSAEVARRIFETRPPAS
jgi:hypothetical protein